MPADVLIAGAGIAGLTTALALRQTGRRVVVLERAPKLAELGAGLQFSPNGTKVFKALGLEDRLGKIASETEGKAIRLWSTGQRWKLFDLGAESRTTYGAPYWTVHRGDLHRELLQAALDRGVEVRTGVDVTGWEDTGRAIRVSTAAGEHLEAAALIGADGIHSILRNQMIGRDRPEFTGIMAWRGVAPMTALPKPLRENVGVNWVGPGRHVITYPLRAGALMNFVGVVERDDWRVESWTEQGTTEECLADFAGWHEDVSAIIRAIGQPFRWALLARAPLTTCAQGRAILIGDACHPTLPFLAQGANMAVEDAMVVTRCLDHYVDPVDAFRAFEAMRLERTGRIVAGSAAQAQRFHNPAYVEADTAAEIIDREWAPERVRERYDWLFRYDPLTQPFPAPSGH